MKMAFQRKVKKRVSFRVLTLVKFIRLENITEKGDSLVITGRYMRSLHPLRNRTHGEIQRFMSRFKKGSRKWRKYNRAKNSKFTVTTRSMSALVEC